MMSALEALKRTHENRALSRSWQFQRFWKEEPFAEHFCCTAGSSYSWNQNKCELGPGSSQTLQVFFWWVPMTLTHAIRGNEGGWVRCLDSQNWGTENPGIKHCKPPRFPDIFPLKNQSIDPSRFFEFGDHPKNYVHPLFPEHVQPIS